MTGDELTKVAGGVVEGLKNQPALLVIVVLNVVMLAAQVWSNTSQQAQRGEIVNKLIEQCAPRTDQPGRTNGNLFQPPSVNPPAINVKKED
jgi:hypothetical protein